MRAYLPTYIYIVYINTGAQGLTVYATAQPGAAALISCTDELLLTSVLCHNRRHVLAVGHRCLESWIDVMMLDDRAKVLAAACLGVCSIYSTGR
jgi:hypothetical protein